MAKTAAQHLHENHKAAYAHHSRMVDAHKAALASLEKASATEPHIAFHKAALASHEKMAAHHYVAMGETAKAIDAVDLNKRGNELQPLPEGLSRVTPTVPDSGVRAVPRIGAAPIEKPKVPLEFAKTFSVEDAECDLRGGPAL